MYNYADLNLFHNPQDTKSRVKVEIGFSQQETHQFTATNFTQENEVLPAHQPARVCIPAGEALRLRSAKTASPVTLKLDKVQGQFSPTTDLC